MGKHIITTISIMRKNVLLRANVFSFTTMQVSTDMVCCAKEIIVQGVPEITSHFVFAYISAYWAATAKVLYFFHDGLFVHNSKQSLI
jgi:hypothetical protein